jgi:ribosomal protein L22
MTDEPENLSDEPTPDSGATAGEPSRDTESQDARVAAESGTGRSEGADDEASAHPVAEEAPARAPRRRRRKARAEVAEETAEPVAEEAVEPAADEEAATPEPVAEAEADEVEAEADEPEGEAGADEAEDEEAEEPEADAEADEDEEGEEPVEAVRPAPPRRRGERDPDAPVPVVRAQAKYVRSSARKARLVCDNIRGKSVDDARAILALTPREIARDWSKLLESAVANAEHNHELVGEDLYVKAVHADEGPTIKRFRPRAMGRATRIRKRTSHLTILLTPKD